MLPILVEASCLHVWSMGEASSPPALLRYDTKTSAAPSRQYREDGEYASWLAAWDTHSPNWLHFAVLPDELPLAPEPAPVAAELFTRPWLQPLVNSNSDSMPSLLKSTLLKSET